MFKILQIFILFFLGISQSFAFDIKMSDSIAPFFDSKKDIKHYSNIPFEQLDVYEREKFVDEKQMRTAIERFKKYAIKLQKAGYNSISLDDINHLILFQESGYYPKTSSIFKRNSEYRKYYKQIIEIAKNHNLSVYLNTDMQFYTNLLEKKVGKIDVKNKNLEKVNKEAFEEIFLEFPSISGVILRIGEGGSSYNTGTYKSKVLYKTPKKVQELLQYLLPIFEKNDKKLIFRTWTIGIGTIGDLMYNPETYDATFGALDSANLIISIKHTPGDYFWFEGLNPTIGYGNLKQLVEIQVRREYEGGGDFPNYMGEYYKQIFNTIKQKKNVIGVYNWNQTGGWGWGKNILFNFGFNFWNEINFYVVGNILKTGRPRLENVLNKYNFTDAEKQVLKNILKNSREIVKKGWYINDFRKQNLEVQRVRIPPLLWIWWDKTTSSPVVLSLIYNSLGDKIRTLEESAFVLGIQKEEIESWKKIMKKTSLNQKILAGLENRYKIFEINHLFKKSFFRYFETGRKDFFAEEISEKIKSYEYFSVNKNYLHFDFEEVKKFYVQKNFSFVYLLLNIVTFFIYLSFFIYYSQIRNIYKNNLKKRVAILGFLVFDILVLLISPFLFLSPYNSYWIFMYINIFLMCVVSVYFLICSKILSYVYGVKIILERSLGKIIYFLAPIIFILEGIIIISFFLGEQFFWKIVTLGLFSIFYKYFLIILFFIYLGFFVYYGLKFSNIHKFLKQKKHITKVYALSFILLIVFLIFVFSLDYTKVILEIILKKIFPSYFFDAGTEVGEFF